jgi:hypothetical protein
MPLMYMATKRYIKLMLYFYCSSELTLKHITSYRYGIRMELVFVQFLLEGGTVGYICFVYILMINNS